MRDAARSGARSDTGGIKVQQLKPTAMQSVDENRQDAFHQFITKMVVGFAFTPEMDSVEHNRMRRINRFRIVKPAIGGRHPVDAKDIARPEREKTGRSTTRRSNLQRDMPAAEEKKPVGRFILVKNEFAGLITRIGRAGRRPRDEVGIETSEKRMRGDARL